MYLKKKEKPTAKSPQLQQESLKLKRKPEILKLKTKAEVSKPLQNQQTNQTETLPDKPFKLPNHLQTPEEQPLRPILGKRSAPEVESNVSDAEIDSKIEEIEIDSTPIGVSIAQQQRINPISEITRSLKHDLRHEVLVRGEDWESSSSLDWEHYAHSADYSAFLSSYE